jgi:hypothetical protein
VLLIRDGEGHTAFRQGNACIDEAIVGYLVDGIVPADGTSVPWSPQTSEHDLLAAAIRWRSLTFASHPRGDRSGQSIRARGAPPRRVIRYHLQGRFVT